MSKKQPYYLQKGRALRLLVDIDDDYYNIHYKKGDVVHVREHYSSENALVIEVHGHGAYTYVKEGQYEFINNKLN